MKIRDGFVSNSSSSSFVLAFDKKPETLGTLVDLIGDTNASAATTLWDCIKNKKPRKDSEVREELDRHWGGDEEVLAPFLEANKGKVFFVVEFGDNHGQITGEHGWDLECNATDYFSKVPIVRFNNH